MIFYDRKQIPINQFGTLIVNLTCTNWSYMRVRLNDRHIRREKQQKQFNFCFLFFVFFKLKACGVTHTVRYDQNPLQCQLKMSEK